MDIAVFVEGLLAKSELPENPINRTYSYTIRDTDEGWPLRNEIADELFTQFRLRYPHKLVDMNKRPDGPGSFFIEIIVKNNPFM